MKEKLQEYALIAEIVGGVAIVASLIFVGFQVQQSAEETALNTRQIQSSAFAEYINNINEISRLNIENPVLVDIDLKIAAGEELTPKETRIYLSLVRMIVQLSELAWQQYENEIISEENLLHALKPLQNNIASNAKFRELWEDQVSRNNNSGLLEYLNSLP